MMKLRPIIVDKDDIVIGGNMRYRALERLGYTDIEDDWLLKADDLTDEQREEFIIKDNIPYGENDWDILANKWDLDLLRKWGMEVPQINREVEEDNFDVDKAYEESEKPKSKKGEIYQLGEHRVLCGDSLDYYNVESLMGGGVAKMLFTSPPYNMAGKMYANYDDNLKSAEYIKFNMEVLKNFLPFLKGFVFWNISYNKNSRWEFIEILHRIIKETGLKFMELIVWNKKHALPITSQVMLTRQYEDILLVGNEEEIAKDIEMFCVANNDGAVLFNKRTNKGITNYWELDTGGSQLSNHLACYPVKLPGKGINLMTLEGDIVVDPFLGSGTTLIACEQVKRKCYGIELDPKYVDVIRKRYAKFIGKEEEWEKVTPKF
jgi:DNA modification methylase